MPDQPNIHIDFNHRHILSETSDLWQLEPGEESRPLKPPLEVDHPAMSTMTPDGHAIISMSNTQVVTYLLNADLSAFEFHERIAL